MDRKSFPATAAAAISLVSAGAVYAASDLGFRTLFSLGLAGDLAAAIIAAIFGGATFQAASRDSEAWLVRRGERTLDMEAVEFLSKQSAGYLLVTVGLLLPYPIVSGFHLSFSPAAAKAVFTVLGLSGGALGFLLARLILAQPGTLIERGTQVLRKQKPIEEALARYAEHLRSMNDPGFQLGPQRIETEAAKGHILVIGATRTGKSLIAWGLIRSVLEGFDPDSGKDQRAILFDAKQDSLSVLAAMKLKSPVKTLNPFDTRAYGWRISEDIRTPAAGQRLGSLLVPMNPHLSQPHWDETLRGLISELAISFMSNPETRDSWTFRDLIYAATNRERACAVLRHTPSGRDLIEMSLTDREHALNVMATVCAKLKPFSIIAALWDRAQGEGRTISFSRWKKEQSILVLGNSHELRDAMRTVNQLLFSAASQAMLDLDNNETRESWVFLDEVRQAGRLAYLTDLMVEGASRGVKVVMCLQDSKGLDEEYGRNLSGELSGQCHTIVSCKLNQEETATNVAAKFGDTELWQLKTSRTDGGRKTTSWELERRAAVLPSEIMRLPTPSKRRGQGVKAFYLTPAGAYLHTMSPDFIDKTLGCGRDPDVPDFIPRPPDDQYLRPWDEGDLKRLSLPMDILKTTDAEEKDAKEQKRPGLKLVSKRKRAANE